MTLDEKAEENLKDKELTRRYRILLCITILIAIPVLVTVVLVAIHYWPRIKPVEVVPVSTSQPVGDKKNDSVKNSKAEISEQTTSGVVTTIDDNESTEADPIQETISRILQQMELDMFSHVSDENAYEEGRRGPSTVVETKLPTSEDQPVQNPKLIIETKPDLTAAPSSTKSQTDSSQPSTSNVKSCDCEDTGLNRKQEGKVKESDDTPLTVFTDHDTNLNAMKEIERYMSTEIQKMFNDFGSRFFPKSNRGHDTTKQQEKSRTDSSIKNDIVSSFKKLDEFLGTDITARMSDIQIPELKAAFKEMDDIMRAIDNFQSMSLDDMVKMIPEHIRGNISEMRELPDLKDIPGWLDLFGFKNNPEFSPDYDLDDILDMKSVFDIMNNLGFGDVLDMKRIPDMMHNLGLIDIPDMRNIPDFIHNLGFHLSPEMKRIPDMMREFGMGDIPDITNILNIMRKMGMGNIPNMKDISDFMLNVGLHDVPNANTVPDLTHNLDTDDIPDMRNIPDMIRDFGIDNIPDMKNIPEMMRDLGLDRIPDIKNIPEMMHEHSLDGIPDIKNIPDMMHELGFDDIPDMKNIPDMMRNIPDMKNIPDMMRNIPDIKNIPDMMRNIPDMMRNLGFDDIPEMKNIPELMHNLGMDDFPDMKSIPDMMRNLGFDDIPDMKNIPEMMRNLGMDGIPNIRNIPDLMRNLGMDDIPDMKSTPDMMRNLAFHDIPDMKNIPDKNIPDMMRKIPDIKNVPDILHNLGTGDVSGARDMADVDDIPSLDNIPPLEDVDFFRLPKFDVKWN